MLGDTVWEEVYTGISLGKTTPTTIPTTTKTKLATPITKTYINVKYFIQTSQIQQIIVHTLII